MKPRWTTIVMIVSLALNLFLVGAAAGVIALGSKMAQTRPARPAPVLRRALLALPPPQRPPFIVAVRAATRGQRTDVIAARQTRREAWAALAAPTADPAAVKTRLAAARALDSRTRGGVEAAIVDYAARLPARDRIAFAQAMAASVAAPPPANR